MRKLTSDRCRAGVYAFALFLPCGWASAGDTWVSAGPAVRGGMKAGAEGSSYVQVNGVHAAQASHSAPGAGATVRTATGSGTSAQGITGDAAIGDPAGYDDRTYDDGYVKRDPGTGVPGAEGSDLTWFWGYDSASQYDPSSGQLAFHATRVAERTDYAVFDLASRATEKTTALTTSRDETLDMDDCMTGYGFTLAAGWDAVRRGPCTVAAAGGITALFGAGASMEASPYAEQVDERTTRVTTHYTETRIDTLRRTEAIVDRYDTGAIDMPPPGHRGTYLGPFDDPPVIPSPLIPNRPSARQETPSPWAPYASQTILSEPVTTTTRSAATWNSANRVELDVDMQLFELWFGPRFTFNAPKRALGFFIQPCVSINAVDVCVDRTETSTAHYADGTAAELRRWSDSDNDTKLRLGAGVAAGGQYELGNGMFAVVQGGYDWVDDVDVQSGPNTVNVDPSGYFAGAALGWRFGGKAAAPTTPAERRAP